MTVVAVKTLMAESRFPAGMTERKAKTGWRGEKRGRLWVRCSASGSFDCAIAKYAIASLRMTGYLIAQLRMIGYLIAQLRMTGYLIAQLRMTG